MVAALVSLTQQWLIRPDTSAMHATLSVHWIWHACSSDKPALLLPRHTHRRYTFGWHKALLAAAVPFDVLSSLLPPLIIAGAWAAHFCSEPLVEGLTHAHTLADGSTHACRMTCRVTGMLSTCKPTQQRPRSVPDDASSSLPAGHIRPRPPCPCWNVCKQCCKYHIIMY
jgi:hypothetical protein